MTTPAGQGQQQNQRRTIEQHRGERAWRDVNEAKERLGEKQKEYRSLARGLNAMIQMNGLGQALAFLKAKGKGEQNNQATQTPHGLLFVHVSNWVGKQMGYQGTSLLEWIVAPTTSREAYRRATAESLAFGNWLRRFAEAELKGE
jgi:CRISPR-associated protein Cmr5